MDRIFFSALFVILFVNNTIGQKVNNKVGDSIYGDFNGDKKIEYAYRKLIKKGVGNPLEDGSPDVYEVCFSDANIKPIKDDFYWFILINEGDLDNDGSDELSVREDPMNGCLGLVKTFTIKKEETYYLIEPFPFYRGSCDNEISINPEDLVEKTSNAVYYYEYEASNSYVVNNIGKKLFGKKNKAFDLKVKQTEKDTLQSNKKNNDTLKNLKSNNDKTNSVNEPNKGLEESPLVGRKIRYKPVVENTCNEFGKVIIEVIVDRNGNVLNVVNSNGTKASSCLINIAKINAKNTKWESDLNAPERQFGYLTYNFSLKE
ncbi:hypothetical protein LXD69_10030 [Flavobacterium sediminilitoris]|uniref:TonB C-terminal domain-containing protein n=1 Tax=Flavobacterium sediminilitoris TaxID=2024526 RepID=A0ABY4HIM9_9FLAO|nr:MULTISPECIES: hypothetical protein [Flavobacterium]UOX32390.1 hypothetical protein LXD69_10030 [Flavobacterium sediminilitoris]